MLVVELILCGIGVAAATVVSVNFGQMAWEEHLGELVGAFGLLVVIFAVFGRIWWAQDLQTRPRLIWFLPAAMALILLPGALRDSAGEHPPLVELLLLLAATYGSALLGILALMLVLAPLEMLGRGILRLLTGRPHGGWLMFTGTLIGLVTTFAVVGAFAVDDLPPGRAATVPLICALLGIPFGYTVESETLLWIARGLAVLLLAMLLASAHFGELLRTRAAARDVQVADADRRRSGVRRAAQIARDRAGRRSESSGE